MKKNIFNYAMVILITLASLSCSKKDGSKAECKTCKALGVDNQTISRKVCSDQEEKDFRAEFAGKEVTCQ